MKKYAINRLNIEIGRWCNMTCQHCFKGKREKLAFNPKYIDKFLDNIYLVNHLYFCGGEASLYIDEMQQILEIFKKKNVPLNFIRVNSNILKKNVKFVEFLNNIGNYCTHSEEIELIISSDKYHLSNMESMGIDVKQYEENKQWYKNKLLNNVIIRENDVAQYYLSLEGNAITLSPKETRGLVLSRIDYNKYKTIPILDELIIDREYEMKNAFEKMMLSAEGYIYQYTNFSYKTQKSNNYDLSLGNVYEDTLENLINKWNNHCDFNNKNLTYIAEEEIKIKKIFNEASNMQKKIKEVVTNEDEKGLLKLKDEAQNLLEIYKTELDCIIQNNKPEKYNGNVLISATFVAVNNIIQMIDLLLESPNGFFRKMSFYVIESAAQKAE